MVTDIIITKVSPPIVLALCKQDAYPKYWQGTINTDYMHQSLTYCRIQEVLPVINVIFNLNMTYTDLARIQKFDEDKFIQELQDICDTLCATFWYQLDKDQLIRKSDDDDDDCSFTNKPEVKYCNLCKNYSLLNGFCTKKRITKDPKDHNCTDWVKA